MECNKTQAGLYVILQMMNEMQIFDPKDKEVAQVDMS